MLSRPCVHKATAVAISIVLSLTVTSNARASDNATSSDPSDDEDSDPSIPFSFFADLTWYDPALCDQFPINCMGDPMSTAGGYYVPDWYDRGLACPSEFPMGTRVTIDGFGELTCIDRGDSIILNDDGIFRFDLLTHHENGGIPRKVRVASADFDHESLSNVLKRGDVGIPFLQPEKLFTCPATSCDEIFFTFGQWVTNKYSGEVYEHNGVDFYTGPSGIGQVYAAAGGTVTFSELNGSCGGTISIDHGNGWETTYCHLTEWFVFEGDVVDRYELIGKAGWSGYTIEGQHVHVMLRDSLGTFYNFLDYLELDNGFEVMSIESFEEILLENDVALSDIYPNVIESPDHEEVRTDDLIESANTDDKDTGTETIEEGELDDSKDAIIQPIEPLVEIVFDPVFTVYQPEDKTLG